MILLLNHQVPPENALPAELLLPVCVMALGYNVNFPEDTYMHAELQRDGETFFATAAG